MARYTLTKTRFREGLWEGVLSADSDKAPPPEIVVTLRDRPVQGVAVTALSAPKSGDLPAVDGWLLEIPIPVEAVGDGVHSFLIRDAANDVQLDSVTLIAGEALADDIRAEVELLRAELDMLKRAFRRHCLETT